MTILGGSGFIGTRLVARLLEGGSRVRIGDKAASRSHPGLHTFCDVRDPDSLPPVCAGSEWVVNLAAEHRDDVRPRSLYAEVNVRGAEHVCVAARACGIQKILFTSSVAVYGFPDGIADERAPTLPFNDYGRTKLQAEQVYRDWAGEDPTRTLVIVRPTVVFGEGNRGNVYNLFRQIAQGSFLMVGSGRNRKSIAYVENVCAFLLHALSFGPGVHVYNYVDTPDLDMNALVRIIKETLGQPPPSQVRIPYPVALLGGCLFDFLGRSLGRQFSISTVRIQKFCAETRFSATKAAATGFQPSFPLRAAIEKVVTVEFLGKQIRP